MKSTTLFFSLVALFVSLLTSCNEEDGFFVGLSNISSKEAAASKVKISIDTITIDYVICSLKPSDNCVAYSYVLVPEADTSKLSELYLFKNESYRRDIRDNFTTPSERPVVNARLKKADSSKKYCVCALSYFHPDSAAVLSYALVVDLNKPVVVSSSVGMDHIDLKFNKKIKSVAMSKISVYQYAVNSGVSSRVALPASASISGESVSISVPTVYGAYYLVSIAKGAFTDFQGNANDPVSSSVKNGVFSGICPRRNVSSSFAKISVSYSGFFNQPMGDSYIYYFTTDNFKINVSADVALYPGKGHCVVSASNVDYNLIADLAPGDKSCSLSLPQVPNGSWFNGLKFESGCFEDEYGNELGQSGSQSVYVDGKISSFVVTRGSSKSSSKYAKFYGIYKASVKSYIGKYTNVARTAHDVYLAVCESPNGSMYVNLVGLFQGCINNGLAIYRVFGEDMRGVIDGSTIEMKNYNWFGRSYGISPGKTFYVYGYKGVSAKDDSDLLPVSANSSIVFELGNNTITLKNGIGLWGYELNDDSANGSWCERYDGNLVFTRVAE